MRILILGGTRFLGRRVAEILATTGHNLTLISRRPGGSPAGARHICAERNAGLEMLFGECFDLVVDFICYDGADLDRLAATIAMKHYVLISSAWLPRLWSGIRADELVREPISSASKLPKVTVKYLSGKLSAELRLTNLRQLGCKPVSLRLPIVLGDGDHTGRLDFYTHRLADGGPIIAVDGGQNYAQIALADDLANVIVRWISETDIGRFQIWEALPNQRQNVRQIIGAIAATQSIAAKLLDVPMNELVKYLPTYLEQEPFWRESALPATAANIYTAVGMTPAVFGDGLKVPPSLMHPISTLRLEELRFLANRFID